MLRLLLSGFISVGLLAACNGNGQKPSNNKEPQLVADSTNSPQPIDLSKFDLQGHRGARGLYPENTVGGFVRALDFDVTTLELDIAISKDNQLIVSHEPWFSHTICRHKSIKAYHEADEHELRIYEMTLEEIRAFDCGYQQHPDFPEQEVASEYKPTLAEVVNTVADYLPPNYPIQYNIETKTRPEWDGIYTPTPEMFVELLLTEINELGIADRTTVQSFDIRTLQLSKQQQPELKVALLVGEEEDCQLKLEQLDFTPEIISPNHSLVNETLLTAMHGKGVKVIPWTVNDKSRMEELIHMGVDGLITDYPNRGREVIDQLSK